jgi:hypothetical protein
MEPFGNVKSPSGAGNPNPGRIPAGQGFEGWILIFPCILALEFWILDFSTPKNKM